MNEIKLPEEYLPLIQKLIEMGILEICESPGFINITTNKEKPSLYESHFSLE